MPFNFQRNYCTKNQKYVCLLFKKNYERKNKRLRLTPTIAVQLFYKSQISISNIIYIDLN